jgi:hypothetical protein
MTPLTHCDLRYEQQYSTPQDSFPILDPDACGMSRGSFESTWECIRPRIVLMIS